MTLTFALQTRKSWSSINQKPPGFEWKTLTVPVIVCGANMRMWILMMCLVFVCMAHLTETKQFAAKWKGIGEVMNANRINNGKVKIKENELKEMLKLRNNEQLQNIHVNKSSLKSTFVVKKFAQKYCGIVVNGAQITKVTDKAGAITEAIGSIIDFSKQPSCDVFIPQITQEKAFESAIKTHTEKAQLSAACVPRVGLLDTLIQDLHQLDPSREPVLITVYKVLTTLVDASCLDEKFSAYTHYINTHTGQVVITISAMYNAKLPSKTKKDKSLKHENTGKKGPHTNLKGGNQKKKLSFCREENCDFGPLDVEILEDNTTCTLNKPYLVLAKFTEIPYLETFVFYCRELKENFFGQLSGDEINGGYSPLTDVAFCGQQVYELYKKHGLFAEPSVFPMFAITNYNDLNTFYTKIIEGNAITIFGNGDGELVYPLTSCDIVGHEFGHGFTDQYSKLEYIGESGGLNEAYSDVVGIAMKDMLYNVQDFLIGDLIVIQDGAFLRDMCNPTVDGYSIDHYDNYYDGIDVHFSSGIVNKMACLMFKSNVFSIDELFVLFSVANRDFWTSMATFNEAVCGLLGAETVLYNNRTRHESIRMAAKAVGLDCPQNIRYVM